MEAWPLGDGAFRCCRYFLAPAESTRCVALSIAWLGLLSILLQSVGGVAASGKRQQAEAGKGDRSF